MIDEDDPVPCATCGDRIGIYEPVWLEEPDGALTRTGLLQLKQDSAEPHSLRLHHFACLSRVRLVTPPGT